MQDHAIVATSSMLLVPVLHAADVDFTNLHLTPEDEVPLAEVDVRCSIDVPIATNAAPEFSGTILCRSGTVTVGDADGVERFEVAPGPLRIAVARDPEENAGAVTIWIHPHRNE